MAQPDSPRQSKDALAAALVAIDDPATMRAFLDDLCTPAELTALCERWHIAQLLDEGELTYREIGARAGASPTTVTRVARYVRDGGAGGYRAALDSLKEATR